MKLSTILILSFLFVTLAGTLFISYFIFSNYENALENQVSNNVLSDSQLIENSIETFIASQERKIELIATQSELSNEELMEMTRIDPAFYDLFVIDSNGTVIASSNSDRVGLDRSNRSYFINARNQTYVSSVYFALVPQQYSISVSTPFHEGVLVGSIKISSLGEQVSGRIGLGETGESLMAFLNENGETVYFTKRLFSEEVMQVVPFEKIPLPMKNALKGNEQLILGTADYRGVSVISASNYIESIGVGMVTKIDYAEAIGVVRVQLIRFSIIATSLSILIVFIIGWLISFIISRSITKLNEGVDNITKGDLSIQLERSNIFEVQKLTDSLNRILATMKLAILRTGLSKGEFGLGELTRAKEEVESKYKILYDSSLDARMTIAPPNWQFAEGNSATFKMFNVKDEKQFEALTPGDLSPKLQLDGQLSSVKAKKMIEQAMKEGKAFFEWTHKRYKGENFSATVLLSRIGEGDKAYLQATVRELTEDFKSKNLIMEMGHLAKIGVWELDVKSGKQIWTDEVYNIHEVDKAQFSPNVHKGINFYTPESKPIIEKAVTEAIKHGKSFDVELDIITAKGNKKIVHARGMPIKEKGKVEKVRGIFQDITKIKRKIKND